MHITLCSASKGRLDLLNQIGIYPEVAPVEIDETPYPKELPQHLARRLSLEKMNAAISHAYPTVATPLILITAHTVTGVGRRILDKATSDDEVRAFLAFYSGRSCKVYTGLCVAKLEANRAPIIRIKLVTSAIRFKRITRAEIDWYVDAKSGVGCSGGLAYVTTQPLVKHFQGSVSGALGLPLYELVSLLNGFGWCLSV